MLDENIEEEKDSFLETCLIWVIRLISLLIFIFTLFLVCIYIPDYINYKLPEDRALIYQVRSVDKIFANEEYFNALEQYADLVYKYPKFKYGIKQMALCAFSLIDPQNDEDEFFDLGVYYISKLKEIDKNTLQAIEKHLPKKYIEKFKRFLI